MPTSVRLDETTERLLRCLARKKARTKSQVIREAIEVLAEAEAVGKKGEPPCEAATDLIGCVSGGPPDLSTDTGRRLRELLAAKKG